MATSAVGTAHSRIGSTVQDVKAEFLAFLVVLHTTFADFMAGDLSLREATVMPIMGAVKMVGSAVIGLAVIALVINEVLTVDAINNSSGPFGPVVDSLETTGVAAMTLLVVALLVVAASYIMGVMDRF